MCPCKIVMSAHAFTLSELTAFKNHTSVHNSVFCSTPWQSTSGNVSFFFYYSFFWQFFVSWDVVLHSTASCFLKFRSLILYLYMWCYHFSPSQYIAINFLLLSIARKFSLFFRTYPILENKRPVSKSVLMIQSYTWFADVNEFIIGEHNCDANADCNNTEGSFECTICKPGYSGNGVYCTGDNSLVKTWFVLMLRLFQYHFVSSSRIWVKTIESKRDISKCTVQ